MPRLGVHARRGTSAPPRMQAPPTACLLPSRFPSHRLPKSILSRGCCRHVSVAQDLSPSLILQTQTTPSGHKNQISARLQHDDLRTEGLQMLGEAWV